MTRSRLITVLFALASFAPVAWAHYDQGTGRWLERDPLLYQDSANLFEAFRSAPASYGDWTGLAARVGACAGINNKQRNQKTGSWDFVNYVEGALSDLGVSCDPDLSRRSELGLDPLLYSGDSNVLLNSKRMLDREAKQMAGPKGALCNDKDRQRVQVLMISPKTNTTPCDVFSGANAGETPDGHPTHRHGCCDIEITVVFDPYDPMPNQEPFRCEWSPNRKWTFWDQYGRRVPVFAGGGLFSDPRLRHSLAWYLSCSPLHAVDFNPRYDPCAIYSDMWKKQTEFDLMQRILDMAAAKDGYLFVCHSQGCNILMQQLAEGCDGCPTK